MDCGFSQVSIRKSKILCSRKVYIPPWWELCNTKHLLDIVVSISENSCQWNPTQHLQPRDCWLTIISSTRVWDKNAVDLEYIFSSSSILIKSTLYLHARPNRWSMCHLLTEFTGQSPILSHFMSLKPLAQCTEILACPVAQSVNLAQSPKWKDFC